MRRLVVVDELLRQQVKDEELVMLSTRQSPIEMTMATLAVVGLMTGGCATSPPQESGEVQPSASATVEASPGTGGTQPLEPGSLAAGTRYVFEGSGSR